MLENISITDEPVWANPLAALQRAAEREDVVQSLVPLRGITWLYGSSMSFKTFIAMSMAAAVSGGTGWLGKQTSADAVVYVGAEGGDALHVRRAAAERVTGVVGKMYVLQERPQLDTPQGLTQLRALLNAVTGWWDLDAASPLDRAEMDKAQMKYPVSADEEGVFRLLCVIDTYAQTASADDRINVSAYVRNLRTLIEEAAEIYECDLSFVVVDHATKAGGSYVGSVAKLNDVDSQLEVIRDGSASVAVVHQRKAKDGSSSEPIPIAMSVFPFVGFTDAYGGVLSTLVVEDGSKAKAVGDVAAGKAGVLLGLLEEAGGSMGSEDSRREFAEHPSNVGANAETLGKAYRRAKVRLVELGVVEEVRGMLKIL